MADDVEIKKITGAVEDAVTYPILVKEVDGYGSGSRGGSASSLSGGGLLTSAAQGAMRDLLGWRYRADDPKGFLAALNKAVDLKEAEGSTEWVWNTRPFMAQADMGEVTGAQASIYKRAKISAEQVFLLLNGLTPLRPDVDKEQAESMRAIVRSAWTELVNELAVVSGPRIQRVDLYFERLLGSSDPKSNVIKKVFGKPETVGGSLGKLRERFGFKSASVLTVEEEQNFTNFLILVDYTTSLLQTWAAQKNFLIRNGDTDKFLGTQLVRLSEELAVIVESVQEVYAAMDSVFFGPEERQVTVLKFSHSSGIEPITVAELLQWIEQFASVEARQLIEDSGKDGVHVVNDTLEKLNKMLDEITGKP